MKRLASKRGFWDAVLLLVIFLGGEQIGSRYVDTFQQSAHGDFYQSEFAPAVLSACGRAFGVNATPVPALNAFLSLRADGFSCDQLPRNLKTELPEYFQTHHRYLLVAAAWTWKVTGVSWRRLSPLFGIFFAITLCAAYGLFRIVGGPIVGLLGVLPLAVSAHHLAYLPHLRDYAKAPLVLLPLLMAAQLTLPPLRPRRSLLIAIAFGLSVGIGFGFRNDLLISLPPFAIAVLWLTCGRRLPTSASAAATHGSATPRSRTQCTSRPSPCAPW